MQQCMNLRMRQYLLKKKNPKKKREGGWEGVLIM